MWNETLPLCRHLGAVVNGRGRACAKCWARECEIHGEATLTDATHNGRTCAKCSAYLPAAPAGAVPDLWPGVPDPLPEREIQPVPPGWANLPAVRDRHIEALRALAAAEPLSLAAAGSGVVICGGGKYWPGIVCGVRMLRETGCRLPVQVWFRGDAGEVVRPAEVAGLDATLVDADQVRPRPRVLRGWEIKTLALLHCNFERVLFLDADAYAVSDPTPLLEDVTPAAPFAYWEDLDNTTHFLKWEWTGLTCPPGQAPVQGGQLLLHRPGMVRELLVAHWINQHSDYWYSHQFGDQDSWRIAFAATGRAPTLLGRAHWRELAFVCYDREQRPTIVHRCQGKLFPGQTIAMNFGLPGELALARHLAEVMPRV